MMPSGVISVVVERLFPELENIESIDGMAFEQLCLKLFQHMYPEYVVQRTQVNDFGADIIVHFAVDRKMVIQCKTAQDGKPVGVRAVQEALASKDFYGAEFACVTSNTRFTPAAEELAEKSNVSLMDADRLVWQFSRTTFGLEDIPMLYERYLESFRTSDSPYLEKFRTNPLSVFEITPLEVLQLTRLCMEKDMPSNLFDMRDDLMRGIHHVIYLAACLGGR